MKKIEFIKKYIISFSSKKSGNISKYYDLPLVIFDKRDNKKNVLIIKTKKDFKNYFDNLFKALLLLYGYQKTKIKKIKLIKKNSIISLNLLRINNKNKIIQRLKCTYFLTEKKQKLIINGFIVE
mgnify:FL=1